MVPIEVPSYLCYGREEIQGVLLAKRGIGMRVIGGEAAKGEEKQM